MNEWTRIVEEDQEDPGHCAYCGSEMLLIGSGHSLTCINERCGEVYRKRILEGKVLYEETDSDRRSREEQKKFEERLRTERGFEESLADSVTHANKYGTLLTQSNRPSFINLNRPLLEGLDKFSENRKDISESSGNVKVVFNDIVARLVTTLSSFTGPTKFICGCVAWLSNDDILDVLAGAAHVAVIVQKSDLFRPDVQTSGKTRSSYKEQVAAAYRRVISNSTVSRDWFPPPLCGLSYGSNMEFEAIRCVGVVGKGVTPIMHHKFWVVGDLNMDRTDIADDLELEPNEVPPLLIPRAVVTGSFNPTVNGTKSMENIVLIESRKIAEAYLREFSYVAAISEPIDWSHEYAEPEWRVGS